MLIHPWDAALDDTEWQDRLGAHDFGQLAVNGVRGEPPYVQPLYFAYDRERAEAVTRLARPTPVWGVSLRQEPYSAGHISPLSAHRVRSVRARPTFAALSPDAHMTD